LFQEKIGVPIRKVKRDGQPEHLLTGEPVYGQEDKPRLVNGGSLR
jgi:hypothetical protein